MRGDKILKSLGKGYYFIAIIGSTLTLFFLLFYAFFCYNNFIKDNQLTKSEILKNIIYEIEGLFKEDAALLKYLGDIIVKQNKNNINEIANLLTSTGDLNLRSLTTSYVSWADDKGVITVSGKAGILKDRKKNIFSRTYYRTAHEQPWSLKLSDISKSIFSSKLVLPSAMGVTNTKGHFIGYLLLGLNIGELERYLRAKFLKNGYHFLITDSVSGNVLIASDETLTNQPALLRNKVKQLKFSHNGNDYDFKKILQDLNLTVFVGHNRKLYLYTLSQEIMPQIIEIFLFFFFLILILSFFKNKIITPIKLFSESVEKILKGDPNVNFSSVGISEMDRLSDRFSLLQKYIKQNAQKSDLLNYTNHLTEISSSERENYYKGIVMKVRDNLNDVRLCLNLVISEHKNIGNDSAIKLISHTSELVEKARNLFTTGKKSFFHINSLLDECVAFYLKEMQQHEIILKKTYDANLTLYHGDRFQLKHLIICIINNILKNEIIRNAQITLCTKYESYTTYENISIHITAVNELNNPSQIRKESIFPNKASIDINNEKDDNLIEEDIELIKKRAEKEGFKLKVINKEHNIKEWVLSLIITEPYPEDAENDTDDNVVHLKNYQHK